MHQHPYNVKKKKKKKEGKKQEKWNVERQQEVLLFRNYRPDQTRIEERRKQSNHKVNVAAVVDHVTTMITMAAM